jgi:hypothetical protein
MLRPSRLVIPIVVVMVFMFACQLSLPTGITVTQTPVIIIVTATQPPVVVAPPTELPPSVVATPEPTATVEVATPEPTLELVPTAIVHLIIPVSSQLDAKPQIIYDQESKLSAKQKEAYAGDEFLAGKYERPFDPQMNYIPFIDIKQISFYPSQDGEYYYGTIFLEDNPALLPDGQFGYGFELDQDLDGRGDLLVWTKRPLTKEWSAEGVSIWKDANKRVGGTNPMLSDAPLGGDGYELKVFDGGVGTDPDMAWSRVSPQDPTQIEIAFKRTLLGDSQKFMWGAWAIQGPDPFNLFDHNDHYTFTEAGSPTKLEKKYYPLKEMFALDNTCRGASGFTPKGNEPGLCPKAIQPTAKPNKCQLVCPRYTTVYVPCYCK